MKLRPTPSEERWLTLARALRRSPASAPFADHTGGWQIASTWSRSAFFAMGLVAALMIAIIGSHLWPRADTIVAGLVSLAAAEWLVTGRRHFRSGIEESLEVFGATALAYECWSHVSTSEYAGAAFLGTALAITGIRLLSPVFTTLAVLAFVLALDAPPLGAGLVCYLIALMALIASGRTFRRPSYALMLDYLVITMPVAGYLWSVSQSVLSVATDYRHAALSQWLVPVSSLLFSGICLAVGFRRRTHAPVIAGMLCIACCAYELRTLTALSLETRLIVWGCLLLLVSTGLERYLHLPRRGITSRRTSDEPNSAGILDIAASVLLTPRSPPVRGARGFEGGGGQFGGGGASGEF